MSDLSITVSDHGIGICPEAQKYLFQPFTQADSSMTRRFGGSGLGLSISKRLAELMHGDLTFISELGKGSSFTCRIRVKVIPLTPKKLKQFPGKTIIVIEKNPTRLQILERSLRSRSLKTICNTSLEETLPHLESKNIHADLALVDNREDAYLVTTLSKRARVVVQTGIIPKYPMIPLWKIPIRESTLEQQLEKALSAAPSPNNPSHSHISESSIRLLLAEDNLMNQKLISRLLKSMGYLNIDIVDNGKQAVEAVKRIKYDIILMDCMMPEMTGMEATQRIREMDPRQQPRAIIALTANAFVENREECFKAGMDDVVTKPISHCKLKEALSKYSK